MADEFQLGSGNWWESTTRNRYESTVGSTTASTSSVLNNNNSIGGGGGGGGGSSSFGGGWPTEIVDISKAARSSLDSVSESGSSMVFQTDHSTQKLQQPHESSPASGGGAATGLLPDPTLQMMGLGLSSQAMDWNQPLFSRGGDKGESSFRSMLQEEASSTNFQQQEHHHQWRHKIYSASSEDSSNNISRGLSLDQSQQFSSNMSSGSINHPNFQLDSSATTYGTTTSPPPNHVLQGLLVSDNNQHQQQQQMNYNSYPISTSYGGMNTAAGDHLMAAPSWSNNNKFPQFLRNSPPKQPPPPPPHHHHHQAQQHHGQLHFSNNTQFWNASSAASMNDVRSSLFPSLQSQIPLPNFEEKTKNTSEAREIATAKKSTSNETSNKRPRNETPAPMPAFKVRKEKMGDRITALQQLVSPFGKTDTASVLSEAIEYIKFLHEQVSVLSTPYLKNGVPLTHQQNLEKSKDPGEGAKQDLRSRGLCLVPVSSTFPVTHETTDFWTPTFGGSFR